MANEILKENEESNDLQKNSSSSVFSNRVDVGINGSDIRMSTEARRTVLIFKKKNPKK